MVMAHSLGLTVTNTKVNSKQIILKVTVDIPGLMEGNFKDFGKTTK